MTQEFTNILTSRLTEKEVRERLVMCSDAQVIDELYTFGQMMLKETIANTRALESKAASMAAYGGALVTLLVSISGTWSRVGNAWTPVLVVIAGISGFAAAVFAVTAIALRPFDWLSQKEWLQNECFSKIERLKGYRILTLWGAMDSHKDADADKVEKLRKSQRWLFISVLFIFLTLLHIGWLQAPFQSFWAALWKVS